jgi:hypothetical protein
MGTKINSSGVTFPDSTVQSTAITTGNVGWKLLYTGTKAFYFSGLFLGSPAYGVSYKFELKTSGSSVLQSLSPGEFSIVTSTSAGYTLQDGWTPVSFDLGGFGKPVDASDGNGLITWLCTIETDVVDSLTYLKYQHVYTNPASAPGYGVRWAPNYLNIKVYAMNDSVIDSCTYTSQENFAWDYPPAPGPSGDCFLSGTLVVMQDGSTKEIQDIQIGDILSAGDYGFTKVVEFRRPLLGARKTYSLNGIVTTGDHMFRMKDGWGAIDPSLYTQIRYNTNQGNINPSELQTITTGTIGWNGDTYQVEEVMNIDSNTQLYSFVTDKGCYLLNNNLLADGNPQ